MKKWKTEKWWTSVHNFEDEFIKTLALPRKIKIHDATLRDGEQTPGVVFTAAEKVEIAKKLDELGIDRIEAGMPAVSEDDQRAIKEITSLGLNAEIYAFARAMRTDIDMAVACGVDGVIIEIALGEPKRIYQFAKWSIDDVIERSIDTILYAKEKGLKTVYFGYDTTRADYDTLVYVYRQIIQKASPDSIGIVDTMGTILPSAVKVLITRLKKEFDIPFEIHTHNDYGMASAISFAAVEAGAEVIHTAINGLGERAGNAQLEPILVGLKTLYGMDTNYNLSMLKDLSDRVAEISNFKKSSNLPMVGSNNFVRESGIGIELVKNQPLAMYSIDPTLVGNKSDIVLGKKSGNKSIEEKLKEYDLTATEQEIPQILKAVKDFSIAHKRTLTKEEFLTIVMEEKK